MNCEEAVKARDMLWKPLENKSVTVSCCDRVAAEKQVDGSSQLRTKKCGPGQPPEPHGNVDSCSTCHRMAAEWRSSPAPAALQKSAAHLPKPVTRFMISRSRFCNRAVASGPVPAPPSGVGEEAATPGQPVRARALSWIPPAIHPRESPVAAGSAAIIRQAQELSRFAASTLKQSDCDSQHKNSVSLWRNCAGRIFPVEVRGKL